jgi:hypothetical protein
VEVACDQPFARVTYEPTTLVVGASTPTIHERAVEGVRNTGRAEVVVNARVAEYHTYFVGDDEWGFSVWAHNQYHARQGYIIFGELDELGRPTGVRATITSEMLGTGSQAAQWIRPPGFGGQAAGHARGHLLGNQLGGSGRDPRNLVTLFQNPVNTPVMRDFENQVAAAVRSGQIVDYWVIPVYHGNYPIPIGVTLRARGSGGFNLDVTILNRAR